MSTPRNPAARARARFPLAALHPLALLLAGCPAGPIDPRVGADGGDVDYHPLPQDAAVSCRGNLDGVITRDEVVFVPGVEVRYTINPSGTAATVDVNGGTLPDGRSAWDFSDPSGDRVSLVLSDVTGQWYAPQFPTAQYASRLDPRTPLLGVYQASADRVDLLGAVAEDEATGTQLRYDTPVALLRFPLALGASWVADGNVTDGMVEHTPVASQDHYEVSVDAEGEVRVAALTFARALRVHVEVTQHFPAGPGNRRIQYLWMVECYGEVARITSRDGEVDPNFTDAAEFRRLSL
jgi:hypothetical protein